VVDIYKRDVGRGKELVKKEDEEYKISCDNFLHLITDMLYHNASESLIRNTLLKIIQTNHQLEVELENIENTENEDKSNYSRKYALKDLEIAKLRFHFEFLGLIEAISEDSTIRWTLTPKGRKYISSINSIKKFAIGV
jgi:hypothetical protein